jgi:hypothetical protein
MAKPAHYTSKVAIPLPSDEAVRRIMGNSFNPEKTLNVIKMFAGTEDMFEATIGLVKAIFQTQGIDPRIREMIILRAAARLERALRMASQHSDGQERRSVFKGDRRGGKRRPGGRHKSRVCSRVQGD